MNKITYDTTLQEIEQYPVIRDWPGCLMKCRQDTWDGLKKIPFGMMRTPGLESYVDRIMNGLQRLCDITAKDSNSIFRYHTEEQIRLQPELAETEMIFFPGEKEAPFVILAPGGGYQTVCSFIEGFPAAAELNEAGYNAFVMTYRIRKKHLLPEPFDDMAAAVKYLLDHREQLGISDQYAVMGFSAGGHLAAEWGTVNHGYRKYGLPAPSAEILCYPAVDMNTLHGNKTVDEMYQSVADTDGNVDEYSIHLHMDENYPPTYFWQCVDDDTVSFENYGILKTALEKNRIQYRTKTFEKGGHGLSQPHPAASDLWMKDVTDYLDSLFEKK